MKERLIMVLLWLGIILSAAVVVAGVYLTVIHNIKINSV